MTSTATKKPPKASPSPSSSKPSKSTPPPSKSGTRSADVHQLVDVAKLAPSPTNPRKHFDQEAIDSLATSLKNVGVIQPIIIRPQFAGSHEIIAGERRYRAAKKAGLKQVPCIIRDLSDDEVIEVQLLENLEREELNAIEEAEAFLKLTTDGGYTQQELADRLKRSQGHIANRIRLLELPEDWRRKVISQEIPATHARAILPYAKYPTIVKAVEEELKETVKDEGFPNVEGFESLIFDAIERATCCLEKASSTYYISERDCHFAVTPELEAELEVIEVPSRWGKKGTTIKRALNTKRWKELNTKAIAQKKAKASQKLDRESKPAKPLTPAEQKARKKKQDEQFQTRVSVWLTQFKQRRIIQLLGDTTFEMITKYLIFFSIRPRLDGRDDDFDDEIKARGGRNSDQAWKALGAVKIEDVPNMAAALVRKWVNCDFTRYYSDVDADDIKAMYPELGGNLERDWIQATPETRREFLELHNREQLLDLATAAPYAAYIKKSIKPTRQKLERLKRGDLIAFIHEACPQPDCPPVLLKLK